MTLLLSASLVNCFLIITIGTSKVGKFYFYSRVFSHTKFHSKLRDSQYLLSDALLYVFPVKNISNANSRFPILYSTRLKVLLGEMFRANLAEWRSWARWDFHWKFGLVRGRFLKFFLLWRSSKLEHCSNFEPSEFLKKRSGTAIPELSK